MALEFTTSCIADSLALFRYSKRLAERSMEQVTDEQLFAVLDPEANSIAIIVKHMAGNMRSRWTDFLTTDGEKPDRNRDSEFVAPPPRASNYWQSGKKVGSAYLTQWPRLPTPISLAPSPFAVRRIPSCRPSTGSWGIARITWVRLCCWPNISQVTTGNRSVCRAINRRNSTAKLPQEN